MLSQMSKANAEDARAAVQGLQQLKLFLQLFAWMGSEYQHMAKKH